MCVCFLFVFPEKGQYAECYFSIIFLLLCCKPNRMKCTVDVCSSWWSSLFTVIILASQNDCANDLLMFICHPQLLRMSNVSLLNKVKSAVMKIYL